MDEARIKRQRRLLHPEIRDIVDGASADIWPYDGNLINPMYGDGGFLDTPFVGFTLEGSHIKEIAKRLVNGGRCGVMVLGPGRGTDIPHLVKAVKNVLYAGGEDGEQAVGRLCVDVLALTDKISDRVKPFVRNNFSGNDVTPTPFETFDIAPIAGGYDVVIDHFGVSEKSTQPHRTVLKEADLLADKGIAYIEASLEGLNHPADRNADTVKKACMEFWRNRRVGKGFSIEDVPQSMTNHCFVVRRDDSRRTV